MLHSPIAGLAGVGRYRSHLDHGLNSPGFLFLRGAIKRLVYETPINTAEELLVRIFEAAHVIREDAGLFQRCRQSIVRRYHLCYAFNGRQFEHHL